MLTMGWPSQQSCRAISTADARSIVSEGAPGPHARRRKRYRDSAGEPPDARQAVR